MRVRCANQGRRAITFVEILAVIVCVAVLWALSYYVLATAKRRSSKLNCVVNLKLIALGARVWEGDNNNLYPMQVSVTNGGAMELIATNNVAGFFEVMSNEFNTTRILKCPEDWQDTMSTNGFGPGFCNRNISYFVGLDANVKYSQRLLFGDDNFDIGNAPVPSIVTPIPSGIAQIPASAYVEWAPGRHEYRTYGPLLLPVRYHCTGNVGLVDGSVAEDGSSGLQQNLIQTGLATNRLAIP